MFVAGLRQALSREGALGTAVPSSVHQEWEVVMPQGVVVPPPPHAFPEAQYWGPEVTALLLTSQPPSL